jgi:hypothetical protein
VIVTAAETSNPTPLFPALPKDWELKPLKRAVCFLEGPGIMAADFENDGVPLLRIAGISGRTASLDGCNFLSPDLVETKWSHFRVRSGDLLISGSASTGLCAEVDAATIGAIPYTGIMIVRPNDARADKNFFRWFFLSDSFAIQVSLAQTGSALKHFGPTHLSQMFTPVPPVPQQRAIANYLDRDWMRWWRRRSGCSGCWPRSAGHSSPVPSPADSTLAFPSATPASHGSARFRRIGVSNDQGGFSVNETNVR